MRYAFVRVSVGGEHNKKMEFHDLFDIERCIGKGSFSCVHIVRHRVTNQRFAAKIINTDSEGFNPDESRIASSLDHPNIIKTRHVFRRGSDEIVVMDLAEGGELFSEVRHRLPLPEDEAMDYIRELLEAINYLHQNGIVHRDIKLENVLMSGHTLKLIDFGFSKVIGLPRTLKSCCGSPHYIAPEILLASRSASEGALKTRSATYGREVDLWAVGVILFVLLVGRYPFHHERKSQWQKQLLTGHFETPADMELSSEALELIRRLLCVDPDRRLTAANALALPILRRRQHAGADESAAETPKMVRTPLAAVESGMELFFTPPTNRMMSADMSP
jgi:serine/threonine protein kinase